jgi:hypothetical protein
VDEFFLWFDARMNSFWKISAFMALGAWGLDPLFWTLAVSGLIMQQP